MDPFTIMAIGGLALQGAGLFGSSKANKEAEEAKRRSAAASQAIAGFQIDQNEVRRNAMELSSRRQQTENIRNAQLQRSMALTAATAQGAQFGSGLGGGIGQISGQANWNALGISQNLEFGQKMFDIDNLINNQKMIQAQAGADIAGAQGDAATWQGISSFGGNMLGASGTMGNVFKGFGGASAGASATAGGFTYGNYLTNTGSLY